MTNTNGFGQLSFGEKELFFQADDLLGFGKSYQVRSFGHCQLLCHRAFGLSQERKTGSGGGDGEPKRLRTEPDKHGRGRQGRE